MPERHAGQLRVVRTREEVRRRSARRARPSFTTMGTATSRPTASRASRPGGAPSIGRRPRALEPVRRRPRLPRDGGEADCSSISTAVDGARPLAERRVEARKVAPLVLAHPTVAWTEPAREVASRFFRRLFTAEMDPVEAAMLRDPASPRRALAGCLSSPSRTIAPSTFDTRSRLAPGAVRPIDFDRHRQRQIASAHASASCRRSRERRVQAFVVVAPPENHAGEIATQLRAYTERQDVRSELTLGKPLDVSAGMFDPSSRPQQARSASSAWRAGSS